MISSTPSLTNFDPTVIPYQFDVINKIRSEYDYSLGVHEILLSGSLGSSKTMLMAHLVVTHCLFNPGARVLIGRRALPDLKATLYDKIKQHIVDDLKENAQYSTQDTIACVNFVNGSQIISRSWADKNVTKVRSLDLSAAAIEELTENNDLDFYYEIKMRVGRLTHVREQFIISATNPGSPSHPAYEYFIASQPHETRHVFYSVTTDNPFLPKQYVEQLKKDLDPKMARRMIYGEWLEIRSEVIYYMYSPEKNYSQTEYEINLREPIHVSWDFNIGEGKPLSVVLFQYIDDHFHFFDEIIIHGCSTLESCEELKARNTLEGCVKCYVHGDATGKARSTKSKKSDYDIIMEYLTNNIHETIFELAVKKSNPPIKTRHNTVNAYCCNSLKQRRLTVYKSCKTLHKGFKLTALKEGGQYIEDDSKEFQHCTTAAGYAIVYCVSEKSISREVKNVKFR